MQVYSPLLIASFSFAAEKTELEIYFPELHVSMFAAILKTWSYLRTIDFKQQHGLLTVGSPSEGGGGGGWGTGSKN